MHVLMAVTDEFDDVREMGGPMEGGILLPWNMGPGGGMSIINCTFVNFQNPCIRGCAHCGRGGSPVLGDGAFETRFRQVRVVRDTLEARMSHV